MMSLKYIKMNGLGNDFVIFDARVDPLPDVDFQMIADRGNGVGCDQILVMEPSQKADCLMRIFNADGGEVSACGNGTRCVSKILGGETHTIEVGDRILQTINHENGDVSVYMGLPLAFYPQKIDQVEGFVIDVGNPHFVLKGVEKDAVLGKFIENHSLFPGRINVNFGHVGSRWDINLTTFERGVGFTKACGTGACATAFVFHHLGETDAAVWVNMEQGRLRIEITPQHIIMQGDANFDDEGFINV